MLTTNNSNCYIKVDTGQSIFKSKSGFVFACEKKILVIKDSTKNGSNFRIYHEGELITLHMLSTLFQVSERDIIKWRTHVWYKVYSASTRKENLYQTRADRRKEIADAANYCLGFDTSYECNPTTAFVVYKGNVPSVRSVDIPVLKQRPVTSGCFVIDAPKEPWKSYFSQFIKVDKTMNTQAQRLARAKQKQREYCINYGMPELLIERNVAFAVTKFYEEEDKHEALVTKQKALLAHDINMVGQQVIAEEKGYKHHNNLTLEAHVIFSKHNNTRNAYAKRLVAANNLLEAKQKELALLNDPKGYQETH